MNRVVGTEDISSISVIICCYNSEKVIEDTLQYIVNQETDEVVNLELIVVDNLCTDNTKSLVDHFFDKNKTYSNHMNFKYCFESNPGLSNARLRGIKEASHEILVFCDDDNRLATDYINIAIAILKDNQQISMLGGCGTPIFESKPDPRILPFIEHYAVGAQGACNLEDVSHSRGYLYGAGMVIRKSHFDNIQEQGFKFYNTGRKGKSLAGSEDIELGHAMVLFGFRLYYASQLKFDHYLTKERLTWDYLCRMNAGSGRSATLLVPYQAIREGFKAWRVYFLPLILAKSLFVTLLKSCLIHSDSILLRRTRRLAAFKSSFSNYNLIHKSWKNLNLMFPRVG